MMLQKTIQGSWKKIEFGERSYGSGSGKNRNEHYDIILLNEGKRMKVLIFEGPRRGKAKLGWRGNNAGINRFLVPWSNQNTEFGIMNVVNQRIIDYCGFMWRLDRDPFIQIVLTYTACASAKFYYYFIFIFFLYYKGYSFPETIKVINIIFILVFITKENNSKYFIHPKINLNCPM